MRYFLVFAFLEVLFTFALAVLMCIFSVLLFSELNIHHVAWLIIYRILLYRLLGDHHVATGYSRQAQLISDKYKSSDIIVPRLAFAVTASLFPPSVDELIRVVLVADLNLGVATTSSNGTMSGGRGDSSIC